MADAGAITGHLWDEHLAPATRGLIANDLDGDEALARRVAVWLGAVHDLGKATPAFAMQVDHLRDRIEEAGLPFETMLRDNTLLPHSIASHLVLSSWLKSHHAWTARDVKRLVVIPGGHHGVFPTPCDLTNIRSRLIGAGRWRDVQHELADYCAAQAELSDDDFARLRRWRPKQPTAVALTALVIMGDWLASTPDLFPLRGAKPTSDRLHDAVGRLRLPGHWRPSPPADDNELFRTRFAIGTMRPLQRSLGDIARTIDEPELIIVEAPTGEGKTAAALAAAEVLTQRFGLSGVMFALPTRATSDAIFSTVKDWIGSTLDTADTSIALVHGNAQFNDDFTGLPRTSRIYGEQGEAIAHWWLSGRGKLATMSSVVVGTIDHVLLAALQAKHLVLRHLGLAGKVVIIDEVHAADSYMSEYLMSALTWLGAYGVPVIALSATLPPHQRRRLVEAYNKGRDRTAEITDVSAYPLITCSDTNGSHSAGFDASGRSSAVQLDELPGTPNDIADAALEAVADGGHVAVICNTVTRAQNVFRRLRATAGRGVEIVLLHSRFLTPDRLSKEARLRTELGPDTRRSAYRRLIVVATQVIEQSLDLDFDLMFTDIAPIDLIIQRAGRLHRHHDRPTDERPATMRIARLVLTGIERQDDQVPRIDPGCVAVYGRSMLLRSIAVLDDHRSTVSLLRSPDDVAVLVNRAYDPRLAAPHGWENAWAIAEKQQAKRDDDKRRAANLYRLGEPTDDSLIGFCRMSAGDTSGEKGAAQVRDADDAIEVVVVQKSESGRITGPTWNPDTCDHEVDLGTVIDDHVARKLARCTVRLPGYLTRGKTGDDIIAALELDFVPTWQESRWLRGMLPLKLNHERRATVAGHTIEYDLDLGLVVDFTEGEE